MVFVFQPKYIAIDTEAQPTSENESHDIAETKKADDRLARYTLWLTIFTGFLAVSTIGLWWVTWRGVRNQIRDTQILERAYVVVEPNGIIPHVDRDDRVHGSVILRNVGHLTARHVRWYGSSGTPDDYKSPPIKDLFDGQIVLPPGAMTRQRLGTVFTRRYEGASNVVSNSFFVWGIVTYDDGFGQKRFTRFCHAYRTKPFIGGDAFSLPGDEGEFHEYGNDAD
jgi:hypothetical protein